MLARLRDDRGSAPAEFVMVGALLTVLTLSVMQLGLALHIRNTVLDAAAEGARVAALADNGLADGVARTTDLISVALGEAYAGVETLVTSLEDLIRMKAASGRKAHRGKDREDLEALTQILAEMARPGLQRPDDS